MSALFGCSPLLPGTDTISQWDDPPQPPDLDSFPRPVAGFLLLFLCARAAKLAVVTQASGFCRPKHNKVSLRRPEGLATQPACLPKQEVSRICEERAHPCPPAPRPKTLPHCWPKCHCDSSSQARPRSVGSFSTTSPPSTQKYLTVLLHLLHYHPQAFARIWLHTCVSFARVYLQIARVCPRPATLVVSSVTTSSPPQRRARPGS